MSPRAIAAVTLSILLSAGAGANNGPRPRDPPSSPPATGPAQLRRPAPAPIPPPPEDVTDAQIEQAIRQGGDLLLKQFNGKTLLVRGADGGRPGAFACGLDALSVYALMHAGLALDERRLGPQGELMQGMIASLKRLPADVGNPQTYARALRATALSVFNRPEDRQALEEDVACLFIGHNEGAYTYHSARTKRGRGSRPTYVPLPIWDNSNSQYGLMGVWSGAEAGVEVPEDYWQEIEGHWKRTQLDNGQWSYQRQGPGLGLQLEDRGGTPSMTAAGIASLFVVRDFMNIGREARRVGRPPFPPALERALGWWEAGDNAVNPSEAQSVGYWLFSVERVGLASGFKYFGEHDWYRTLARRLIRRDGMGAVGDGPDSAYSLLFLARARHPILMNKLRFDGYWSNRPRDLAALARFVSKRLERPLNWQVVPIDRDWSDWTDAPVLYLASHDAPKLAEKDFDHLRSFALAGGLIFTHADEDAPGSGERFDQWVEKTLARKLFPQYEMADLPEEHPIYTFPAKPKRRLPLRGLSNGWRLLLVHSPKDLAYRWQTRDERMEADAFQTGLNIFVYAAGTRDFRRRLEPTYVPAPSAKPSLLVPVARVRYAGAWDPEPYAWERFSHLLEWKTGYALNVQTVDWKELRAETTRFAHLTGSVRYDPAPAELAALTRYVQEGGVLLIDDCGGRGDFARSMRKALQMAWPQHPLAPMPPTSAALNEGEPGMIDVSKPKLRPSVIDKVDAATVALKELAPAGHGCAIFSDIDVTCGLLGANTYGLKGYEPFYAQSLVSNLILWSLDGRSSPPATRPAEAVRTNGNQ